MLTAVALAVKPTLVAPAATVTEAGTVTEELLLVRLRTKPPPGAAEFSVTVQASVAVPVTVAFAQESAVGTGAADAAVKV